MNLGWCDVCLKVADVRVSRGFYETLGFRKVDGNDDEGWAIVIHDAVRLGLYESQHVGEDALTLNFRGGDVVANAQELTRRGLVVEKGPTQGAGGGWSAWLRDPDGYSIFLDTGPDETMPT